MDLGRPLFLLFALLIIPVGILFIAGYKKKKNILEIVNIRFNMKRRIISYIIMGAGLFLILISLSDIRIYKGNVNVEKKNLDIYVMVDVSKSMATEDIKPSRIERAKEIMYNLLEMLRGDRLGIIPFAGDAYIQMPFTDDYDMAKLFVDVIDTDMIAAGGTDINKGIKLADDSFTRSGSSGQKVVIILSDGEDHDNKDYNYIKSYKDMKIYTVGIGTDNGGLIPVKDQEGNPAGYKKDENDSYVTSRLNGRGLAEIAAVGHGKYYQSTSDGREIKAVMADIMKLKRDSRGIKEIKDYDRLFQYILGLGILLFAAGYFYRENKK